MLKHFPRLGKELMDRETEDQEIRFLLEGVYKIFYRLEDDEIHIVELFDTRQNPDKLIL